MLCCCPRLSIRKIHPNITLNPTFEEDNRISFLDLQIIRKQNNIEIDMYRKPTTTNTTINYISNHLQEHKVAAYRHLIRRMNSLPLTQDRKEAEWRTIRSIAKSNNFPIHTIRKLRIKWNKKNTKNRQQVDHLHIPQPTDQENHQHIQKHKPQNNLQKYQ
jgi:hypothetical protein